MRKNEKGREVLQHQATQEAATLHNGLSADDSHLTTDSSISDALRSEWAHAVALFDENLPVFEGYVAVVRRRIERDNGWTGGTDFLREFIRSRHFVTASGDEFKANHNHSAVWCREVCRRWPDVAPHILPRLRPSRFDVFYPDLFGSDAEA